MKKLINATHLSLYFDSSRSNNILSFLENRGLRAKKFSVNRKYGNRYYTTPLRHIEISEAISEIQKAILDFQRKNLQKSITVWQERLQYLKELRELCIKHDGKIPKTSDEYPSLKKVIVHPLHISKKDKARKEAELREKRTKQKNFIEKWNSKKDVIFRAETKGKV